MSEVLEVAVREQHGKLRNRRLRIGGKLPAVLYGHGEKPVSLSISSDQLSASLRHGAKVVELKGAAKGQALLQAIQWDTFHQHVLHVDLLRVDAKDRVTIEVEVVLRGEAPGTREGGLLEHLLHQVEIETSPNSIPENLVANVNDLHLGDAVKVSDLEGLPAGATYVGDADQPVAQCIEQTAPEEEEAAAEGLAVEPELIGKKEDEEEAS
ncbi:MAG: 50S ribosomal protein L25 [Planctomycetales bacterium]|nr:50S ribosomal protein L25 [Planctomycetales bacterium]